MNRIGCRTNTDGLVRDRLAEHAAPVLVGLKSAGLIWIPKKLGMGQKDLAAALNRQLQRLPVQFLMFYETSRGSYVLVYQEELLQKQLKVSANQCLLYRYGYQVFGENLAVNLQQLRERFCKFHCEGGVFPHELGVFLGYPAADVEGYIRNGGKDYLVCGYWKVYQNAVQAKRLWQQYDNARSMVIELVRMNYDMAVLMDLKPL